MLGRKQSDEQPPPLLAREKQIVAAINKDAYNRLGERYLWFNKIRTAKKGHFPFLQGQNLEEQMEATRSALVLVGKQLNGSLAMAFNSTLEAINKSDAEFEGLPGKLEIEDRTNPPPVNDEQDALILSFYPLRFLNLAKMVRDKGKGIDFYAEGLIKKFYFKVLAYYGDPANWHPERLAFMFQGLTEESELAEINSRLSTLKTDLELFIGSCQPFKFGRLARGPGDAGTKNTLEETFNFSDKELIDDLYLQTFIANSMGFFLFRYYLTLLAAAPTAKAYRPLTSMFLGALAKAEEMRIRFQASFNMEREKIRLRAPYMEFYKAEESKPVLEVVKVKGKDVRKINYSNKLLEVTGFVRASKLSERAAQNWQNYFKSTLVARGDSPMVPAMLTELLYMITKLSKTSVDGKLEVVKALREYASDQEKMGLRQIQQKKAALEKAKRAKLRTASKFRATEQFDMVKTIEAEAADMEQKGLAEIRKYQDSVTKRRETMLERAKQLTATAKAEGEKNLGLAASTIYDQIGVVDLEQQVRASFVPYLLDQLHSNTDPDYIDFFKHLFVIVKDLVATEKIVMREALASKVNLADDDLQITSEEMRGYEELISAQITEIGMEVPQIMEHKLMFGQVNTTVGKLIDIGLTTACLKVVLQLPVNLPSKPASKLPSGVVHKLLALNQLKHPFATNDALLHDVKADQPPGKRIAFNRLDKMLS